MKSKFKRVLLTSMVIGFLSSSVAFADTSTTALLLQMDGSNNSINFVDETGKSVVSVGNAQISTNQFKFGGASAVFDGSGDYLTTPMTSDFNLLDKDFTIESWVYPRSTTGVKRILGLGVGPKNSNVFLGYGDNDWGKGSGVKLNFGYDNGSGFKDLTSDPVNMPLNTWHHIAVSRKNGIMYMFFNGNLIKTFNEETSFTPTSSVFIGARMYNGVGEFLDGYIDDLCVINGSAKYTANFIPEKITTSPSLGNESISIESSASKIEIGKEFMTDVVLHGGVKTCAEDVLINYNKDLFEYLGFVEVPGFKVYKEIATDGGVRFITASKGKDHAINGDKTFLKLKFRAKREGTGKVDVITARIADNGTVEKDIKVELCGAKEITVTGIKDVNRTGNFTLLDLGIDAWYYGTKVDDTDKSKYDCDVVVDSNIDDFDLISIVTAILSNAEYKPHQ